MKLATWNVNSIKVRLDHVKKYLADEAPDVLMVQELKSADFPAEEFASSGYQTAAVPQKGRNGVAVFSKTPLNILREALPGNDGDEQARYIEFETGGLRLINIYLPNGNPVDTEKFPYKLEWMDRLIARLKELRKTCIPFAIGGDFNVIPENRDCYDPKAWQGDALFRIEARQKFRAMLNLGMTDAFRIWNTQSGEYTFWDYQAGCWPQNKGIRIDHFLLSPSLTDRLASCNIHKGPRSWDKPSDHTPVMIELAA